MINEKYLQKAIKRFNRELDKQEIGEYLEVKAFISNNMPYLAIDNKEGFELLDHEHNVNLSGCYIQYLEEDISIKESLKGLAKETCESLKNSIEQRQSRIGNEEATRQEYENNLIQARRAQMAAVDFLNNRFPTHCFTASHLSNAIITENGMEITLNLNESLFDLAERYIDQLESFQWQQPQTQTNQEEQAHETDITTQENNVTIQEDNEAARTTMSDSEMQAMFEDYDTDYLPPFFEKMLELFTWKNSVDGFYAIPGSYKIYDHANRSIDIEPYYHEYQANDQSFYEVGLDAYRDYLTNLRENILEDRLPDLDEEYDDEEYEEEDYEEDYFPFN